jgi:signal peptidase I
MEEILLYQTYTYARITPFKNYSKFPRVDESHSGIHKQLSYEDKYGGSTTTEYYDGSSGVPISPLTDEIKKKKTRFFYWDDEYKNAPIIRYASTHKLNGTPGEFYVTKDRHIKKYYNEPLSEISVHILERSIIKRGDKVTIKTNKFTKHRGFNCKYFKTNKYTTSVTFDMVKGDFLLVDSSKHGRTKNTPKFRKNGFQQFNNFLDSTDGPFKFLRNHMGKNNPFYKELKNNFKDKEFNDVLSKVFNINFPTDGSFFKTFFYEEVMRWFINTKKIKTPNDYKKLLVHYYPTEKYLKKNDRKLIASVLDVYQIKSKVTIKLLHEKPNIDLGSLYMLCYLFGNNYQKYIGSINKDLFGTTSDNDKGHLIGASSLKMMENIRDRIKNHGYDISDIEKENLLSVLTSETEKGISVDENFMALVMDHFRMLSKIREYDPNIRMRANTRVKFHSEHNELSRMISAIKKGWVIQYFYPEETIRQIQQPIKVFKSIKIGTTLMGTDMDDYINITPYVLTREEEYIEEGKFMHHCVASYAETDTSMIVSLRTEDEQDRVTCEFQISNGNLIQARYFSNAIPPKQFEYIIESVTDLVRIHARFGTLNWLKKDRVPIKINGIEIAPEMREPRRLIDILDLDDAEPLPFF